ncbi:GTPase Era, partial [candidate division WOR-3 bacterium]|nr:GTPase Era [candidate division WOR-3 bacterium]
MKSGFCTILGRTNVGKSTLLNRVLGKKICAVSRKPQTTRHRILGILTDENSQISFLDTPGIMKPAYELQRIMVKTAFLSIVGADVAVVIVEPYTIENEIIKKVDNIPIIVAINKIDLIENRDSLQVLIHEYYEKETVKAICPISALTGEGVNELIKKILSFLPEGEPFYPEDI